ncbi:zinc-binding dehydrogenase [Corynebacterium pacaense]|uniref:zinc-binding dehydrogenase n=1 Tax=Corynebacterium pacaense TaxID=1816684 RepID=UPI0009BC1C29|nr:zinc-binding dehydrogenase [Corynebacterium pacaense]
MKAWLLDRTRTPLREAEVDTPTPGRGQLLVRVHGAGLCHSDVAYTEGQFPFQIPFPVVLGHEVAGEVVERGEDVEGFSPGDRVVSATSAGDAPGITRSGGYAEYTLLTAAKTVHIPEGVSWAQAAASSDAGLTSYTGVVAHGGAAPGSRIGIVGLGGLGMTGARIAVLSGATVYAAEPREEVWETARANGVTEIVSDVSGLAGKDLDAVIDFAGFGTTTSGAIDAVRPEGRVVIVGLGRTEATVSTMALVSRNVTLRGSTPAGNPGHLSALLDWIARGDLEIALSEIDFDDIPAGLSRLARGEVTGRLVAVF